MIYIVNRVGVQTHAVCGAPFVLAALEDSDLVVALAMVSMVGSAGTSAMGLPGELHVPAVAPRRMLASWIQLD